MRQRTYTEVPDIPRGHVANPQRGFFSVIIPLERTNLITNPSVETATTGWSDTSASTGVARTTAQQYHGAYSITRSVTQASANPGIFYSSVTTTTSVTYVVSCRFLCLTPNIPFQIGVATTAPAVLKSQRFLSSGWWQWVWCFYTETSGTTRTLDIRQADFTRGTPTFYVDGAQWESCADGVLAPTTYIDGDQLAILSNQFPAPYRWNGTRHASTSTRLATTRAGGYVVNLDQYRYKVINWAGLGVMPVENIASIPAIADGGVYQATVTRPRQFVVNGFFDARTRTVLDQQRTALANAIGPDSTIVRQPLTLVYQPYDCVTPQATDGRIAAAYQSGLEGIADSPHREDAPITFMAYTPTVRAGDGGSALSVQTSLSNAAYIAERSAAGAWGALSTGGNGTVRALAYASDGKLYAGGDFTAMGGVANTDGIAYWDGAAWNAMGTGISSGTNTVRAIAIGPDGKVYVGGDFSGMGGVANTARIAYWDGAAWNAMGTGGSGGDVYALAVGPDGQVYAAGTFTLMGGAANTVRIARWDSSAWNALSTGLTGGVSPEGAAMVFGIDGTLYVTGQFTTAGGTAAADIASWDGSAFSALSTGLNGSGLSLAVAPNGVIYVGGGFTTAGGVSASLIASWNGTGFSPLGAGVNAQVRALHFINGLLYVGGQFTTAGTLSAAAIPDSLVIWNGSAFVTTDVNLPIITGVGIIYAITSSIDGRIAVGYDHDASGSPTAAASTTATNNGTARTYPIVTINGPSSSTGRVYQLANVTTDKTLYFNLVVSAGEVITLRTSPHGTTVTSSARGDITSALLPGSSPDFALARGSNTLLLFCSSSTMTATGHWPLLYQTASDLTPR